MEIDPDLARRAENDGELMRRDEAEIHFFGVHGRLPLVEEVDMMVAPSGYDGLVSYPPVNGRREHRPLTQSERRMLTKRKPSSTDLYLQGLRERFEREERVTKMGKAADALRKVAAENKVRADDSGRAERPSSSSGNAGGPASSSKEVSWVL